MAEHRGGPRRGPGRVAEKPHNMKKAMSDLLRYCRRDMPIIVIALILSAGGAILGILGPRQISRITDLIATGLSTGIDMAAIARIGLLLMGLFGFSALFTFLQHYLMAGFNQRTSKRMRKDIVEKINRLQLSYFNFHEHGDVLSRVTNDVDTVSASLSNSLASIVSSTAQFIGCLIMMVITNWVMAATSVFSTFLAFLLMMIIVKSSQKYFVARQKNLGNLNGYIEEMYTGHDVIRITNADQKVKDEFDVLNRAVKESNFKSQFLGGLMQPLMGFIGNFGYVAVCVVGAALAMRGTISFGVITAFMIYVRQFQSPVQQIGQAMTNIQSAAAAAERVFEFLGEEELEEESGKAVAPAQVRGEVEFRHVTFAYPDKPEETIIHDFSAHVYPGQKVAICGPTGAGKTTLVNLLMRFYETTGGDILIDGINIKDMKRSEVHDRFGMVLQDTWLFEGTVRENLLYNTEHVTDEQMKAACKACGIHSFIKALPEGYDTVLNDNTAISAGQKQLMTIARAMIQNSPMLILDEATSSVDTRTELITQQAMDRMTEHRTSFVIAHRLSTIRNADMILVLRDGDIVEQGNHEQLLAQNGFYAELYNSQFETVA
ncbi:MAG: ABC transporter ATP-binding protein [Oscillospiraceae bacterium]|nr:ABC transporter ATP-binding protein [Oscillospiraceae bacterium]